MDRLTRLPTLRIDPTKEINFTYSGHRYVGLKGDSVATALYTNGIRIFSRSIKYHRPRGLYSLDGECSNCLMEIDGVPNVPAERTLLKEGMNVRAQNVAGSPERDLKGFMDKFSCAMPAGFYYRYFHRPYRLWPFFLGQIRKTAGLGVIDPSSHLKGRFDEQYLNTDVCVIGGGPAGILAALAAAGHGLRVILLEARPWLGGVLDYRTVEYTSGVPLYKRARDIANQVENHPQVRVFTHTPMIGLYNNHITAFRIGTETDSFDERYLEIGSESVVVATGCTERPLVFENNERPGVMQTGCAHRLPYTYGVLPGECVAFSIGHDLGLEAARDLSDLGLRVTCVADSRTSGQDPSLLEALAVRRIPLLMGWVAIKAHGKTIKRVTLGTTDGKRHLTFDCDILVASAGLCPASGLLSLSQGKMSYDGHTGFFLPKHLPLKVHAAGRLYGLHHPQAIEISGRLAGLEAVADCGIAVRRLIKEAREEFQSLPGPPKGSQTAHAPVSGRKSFVCFDEDATLEHVHQACDMGFNTVELAKRFTAASTGPGQGGIPGHNLPLVVSRYLGFPSTAELPSTVRPPLVPTLLATYAGKRYEIFKRTPAYESQKEAGAIFRRIGVWKRARYFSQDFSAREEIENVRNNVGIIDVSSLGKFRIFGPDALKVLQRVYVGDMEKIPEGRVKYSVMCNDDGCLIDDGVVVKRAENDYYFTTSTGRADFTIEWIRYHTRYDGWDFHVANLTDVFGAINLAGPKARQVLEKITDADVSNERLHFCGYREFRIDHTVPLRVMRLGFLGELAYEIHMPASFMQTLWDLLLEAGKEYGIRPFGLEAQNVLRLEKGHIIVGQESEIRTTLHDLGLGSLWYRNKPEMKTVGAPALRFTEHQQDRMKLVGFEMDGLSRPPKDGGVIVDCTTIRGYIFTARYSVTLKKSIGFALVEAPFTRTGTRLAIFEDNMGKDRLYARVTSTPFYDPDGERLRM